MSEDTAEGGGTVGSGPMGVGPGPDEVDENDVDRSRENPVHKLWELLRRIFESQQEGEQNVGANVKRLLDERSRPSELSK